MRVGRAADILRLAGGGVRCLKNGRFRRSTATGGRNQLSEPAIRFHPARRQLRQIFWLFLGVDRNRAEGNRGLSPVVVEGNRGLLFCSLIVGRRVKERGSLVTLQFRLGRTCLLNQLV